VRVVSGPSAEDGDLMFVGDRVVATGGTASDHPGAAGRAVVLDPQDLQELGRVRATDGWVSVDPSSIYVTDRTANTLTRYRVGSP
jgi:pseudouridine-5'-phosphate glycosidase